MSDDERRKLVSTEQSLGMDTEPKMPTAISGLETFSLSGTEDEDGESESSEPIDADSFFNLPDDQPDVEEEN
jgi:hypothetical protein